MRSLMLTQFGSRVYGTEVPSSDQDFKGIFLPASRDILLQSVPETIQQNTKKDKSAKNTAEDKDVELFSYQKYLDLLMSGQTVAIDMLFTPSSFYEQAPDNWWTIIQNNKHRFISAQAASFVGYCRTQANKYGIKGSRIKAMREIIEFISTKGGVSKIGELDMTFMPQNSFTDIIHIKGPRGLEEPHLQCCNRKIPFHASVKYAKEIFQKIFDEYGHRARLAESNEGVDFKALYHAVRVAEEAKELLLTGHITFPRPEAPLLLKIRKGEMPYAQVADIIENGLVAVEEAKTKSVLPASPDVEYANELIVAAYEEVVKRG